MIMVETKALHGIHGTFTLKGKTLCHLQKMDDPYYVILSAVLLILCQQGLVSTPTIQFLQSSMMQQGGHYLQTPTSSCSSNDSSRTHGCTLFTSTASSNFLHLNNSRKHCIVSSG